MFKYTRYCDHYITVLIFMRSFVDYRLVQTLWVSNKKEDT